VTSIAAFTNLSGSKKAPQGLKSSFAAINGLVRD